MVCQKYKRSSLLAFIVLALLGAFAGVLFHVAAADHADDFHISHQCQICSWYQLGACLVATAACFVHLTGQRLVSLRCRPAKTFRDIPTFGRAPPLR